MDDALKAYHSVPYPQAKEKLIALETLIRACQAYLLPSLPIFGPSGPLPPGGEAERERGVKALLAEASAERDPVEQTKEALSQRHRTRQGQRPRCSSGEGRGRRRNARRPQPCTGPGHRRPGG